MVNYKGRGRYLQVIKQQSTLTVNNSETYVNTDLKFNAKLGKSYIVYMYCTVKSHSSADSNYKLTLGTYVGTTEQWGDAGLGQVNDTLATIQNEAATTDVDEDTVFIMHLTNVTTAGTITLQFAQATATVYATLFYAGNVMTVLEY